MKFHRYPHWIPVITWYLKSHYRSLWLGWIIVVICLWIAILAGWLR